MAKSPKELLDWAKKEGVEFVDIRFCDMLGSWQHFTMPLHAIDEEAFDYGIGFDGSSIRGWKAIQESDMLARLDPGSAFIDPFFQHKTLNIIGDIYDPITLKPYDRDPRYILKKALDYMQKSGIADTVYFGPEAEFFIFSDVRFDSDMNKSFVYVDSPDARWNMGTDEGPNLGYKIRVKEGYFPVPPADMFQDLRSEMLSVLERCGVETEKQHHEVATGGQAEINFKFDQGVRMADKLMIYKYVLKNVAIKHGYTVTFMPKPLFGDNGSGMHCHQSLWKGGKNLFAGDKYAHMSDLAMNYIGGILNNLPSIAAFTNPTTNSYKRLVPGYEAPISAVYSARNRSAAVRIPIAVTGDKARRIEFRTPDPSACPYLAFAAMLMAGLEGVQKKTDPGKPVDFSLYETPESERAKIKQIPGSLSRVLDELQKSHAFLTQGGVFDQDFIDNYIGYKRGEAAQVENMRPHPHEFVMYYDA